MTYRLLSLSFVSLAFAASLPVAAASVQNAPHCDAEGSRSEGWYSSEGRISYAQCAGCTAVCDKIGTKEEGWYSSCDSELIRSEKCGSAAFTDVPSTHVYAKAIANLRARGIISGYSDGTYRPTANINRAEFAKIVIGAKYSKPEIEQCLMASTFQYPGVYQDVEADAWFVPHLCVASINSIIVGNPDGTFRPGSHINFAEAAKILALTFDTPTPKPMEGTVWYKPYLDGLKLSGALPGSFIRPDQLVTRGEMAFMIDALLDQPIPTDQPVVGEGCKVSGCSATICQNVEDEEMMTTCEWREEYACYQHATCEKQSTGTCGWTQTETLNSCVNAAR